tara:strand:- start:16267 stop:18849 length:2583 start_codon:yes stop_codon:yes gene_type:complete
MSNTEKIIVQVQVKGQRQLENLGKTTDKATKRVGGLTKNIAAMGAGILGAVAAFRQINRFITSSIKTFRDFEFQMSKVKAITGASTEDFLKLSQTAEDLGRTTFFTAQQVAELQTNFGKLGFTTQEILDAQKATLDLATATGSDLARAATVAGASVRGFGLDASETQRVVDVMAVSFTSSAMDIEKFQTSMTKVAPIAKASGFSLEDTTAIMSKLTDAGIEASIAGTSLRNILLKMQDPNSDLVKSFGQTIHSYDQLIPAMNKFVEEGGSMADIMEVVDLRQAAAFEQMISNTDSTLALRDAMLSSNGAAEAMAAIVGDNLEGAFKRLNSAFEGLLINFTESVLGKSLQRAVDGFANLLNVVSDFVDIPMSEKLEAERDEMNALFAVLKDTSTSQETRNRAIQQLNIEYGAYLPNLITEKDTLKELSEHQANANKQLVEKIKIAAAEETLTDIMKEQQKIEKEIFELNVRRNDNLRKLEEGERNIVIGKNSVIDKTQGQIDMDETRIKKLEEESKTYAKRYEDALKTAEKLGIKLTENSEVESKSTPIVVKSTKAIKENTKAKEDNAIATDFLTTVSDDYFNSLMEDVINGTATIEEQEQKLRDFQVDLLNNLLQDEQLTYEQRVQLEKQLNALKLQNMETEKQARQQNIDSVASLGDQLITLAGEDEKMQGIRRVGIALSSTAAIANNLQALSEMSLGVASQAKLPFPANIIAMITTLSTLVSLFANIKTLGSVFADGGIVEKFANGGMVHGKSHAFGGEKFAVGGRVVELEGGEAVINKRSTAMFRSQLSAMNSAGGGVKFADGGLLNMPSFTQQQFNAVGQNQMMGAVSQGSKVVVVESDITQAQQSVSVIESQVTF